MTNTEKRVIDEYNNSKDSETVKLYLSGVYLLLNIQQDWWDMAEELMLKHHVMNGDFKQKFYRVKKELNSFEIQLRQTIQTEEKKKEFLKDYETVANVLTRYILGSSNEENKES